MRRECPGRGGGSAAVALHHQAGAAARDVRDDRGAAMQLGHGAEADGERELDGLALAQAHVAGLDENAGRAQVAGAAKTMTLTGQQHVNGRAGPVACRESPLHCSSSRFIWRVEACGNYALRTARVKRREARLKRYVASRVGYARAPSGNLT